MRSPRALLVRMDRVAVAAERGDRQPTRLDRFAERAECPAVGRERRRIDVALRHVTAAARLDVSDPVAHGEVERFLPAAVEPRVDHQPQSHR